MPKVSKYGLLWADGVTELQMEMECIRRGGEWTSAKTGKKCGAGLFHHYREMQRIIWPNEDQNRWSDLMLSEFCSSRISVLSGVKNSSKTHSASKFALCYFWVDPENTLVIISSTDLRSLELRIWGDVKGLFRSAKERHPELAGVIVDSKHAICVDDLADEDVVARDMRKGIICVPCKTSSGGETNISNYVGIKQKRRLMVADEFQFMTPAMYEALCNQDSGNFKLIASGNPIGQGDPLDIISEPEGGWDSVDTKTITKTTVWKNKSLLESRTINLVGLDSPNFDAPWKPGDKPRYPYLFTEDEMKRVEHAWGKDSHKYWSQCVGLRMSGLSSKRVLTEAICAQGRAFDDVDWDGGSKLTSVFALDAAYSGVGGDRCVGGHLVFGQAVNGVQVLAFERPSIVPVSLRSELPPEDQIALWIKSYCTSRAIPASNVFYDATGRGSLGTALARAWSSDCNPVEFGGRPSDRPVHAQAIVWDPKTGKRRLQTCAEHYSKFVTELWFSVRYAVEASQVRSFPKEVASEFYLREWREVANGKVEVESKEDMKIRIGKSPDLADWAVTAVEGARRLGFRIGRLGDKAQSRNDRFDWLVKLKNNREKILMRSELKEA